jgi:hypothetical protein
MICKASFSRFTLDDWKYQRSAPAESFKMAPSKRKRYLAGRHRVRFAIQTARVAGLRSALNRMRMAEETTITLRFQIRIDA